MHGEVVSPANFNEPSQTVIAGHAKAVERASEALKAAGAKRVLPLPVSAPFHCALMQPVVPRLDAVLSQVQFKAPSAPVVLRRASMAAGARPPWVRGPRPSGSARRPSCCVGSTAAVST